MTNQKNPGSGGGRAGGSHACCEHPNHTDYSENPQEQTGNRDRPLTLRLDYRSYSGALQDAIGRRGTDTLWAIIFDLASSGQWTSYSRVPAFYDRPRRYQNGLFSFRKIVGAIDVLAELNLIDHIKRPPGWRGWQSAACATPELVEIYNKITDKSRPKIIVPNEPILLRDAEKKLLDYRETNATRAMRTAIGDYNYALAETDVQGAETGPIHRIFNRNFNSGGRLYVLGASWQQLRANDEDRHGKPVAEHQRRAAVRIQGEEVTELDFATLHPRLLYAEVGKEAPADCYQAPGWPRDVMKMAVNVALNAPTQRKALGAIANDDKFIKHATNIGRTSDHDRYVLARAAFDAAKAANQPIAQFFGTGAGLRLMKKDSDIAQRILTKMLKAGVVVLPVHDSFMAPKSKGELLRAVMEETALEVCGHCIPVDVKF